MKKYLVLYFLLSYCMSSNFDGNNQTKLKQFSSSLPVKQYDIIDNSMSQDSIIVGSGDILNLDIVSSSIIANYDLLITNSGYIVIPVIGKISIDKYTLSKASEKVENAILDKYDNASVSVTFKKAGKFKIHVLSSFNNRGPFEATAYNRVSDIFFKMLSKVKQNDIPFELISNRNVELIRNNKVINCDLLKYRNTSDGRYNPYLMRGDKIRVNYIEHQISIWGGVNQTGNLEYQFGDSILDILNLMGGLITDDSRNSIKVVRNVNKEYFLDNSELISFKLFPNDKIYVVNDNIKKDNYSVFIEGEVVYPGLYEVIFGKTTIYDLVSMAGGYTEHADSSRVMLKNDNLPKNNFNSFKHPSDYLTTSDLSWFSQIEIVSNRNGLVQIDKSQYTFYSFNPGDKLFVPPLFNFIEIIGAVNNTGRYKFSPEKPVEYYIDLAGGRLNNFSYDRYYVIRNGSNIRIPVSKNTIIHSGDIIFVPQKFELNKWERFKDWMTISSQIATFVLIIQNILQPN